MVGVTQCRDAQPEQVFSDISNAEGLGESDA